MWRKSRETSVAGGELRRRVSLEPDVRPSAGVAQFLKQVLISLMFFFSFPFILPSNEKEKQER